MSITQKRPKLLKIYLEAYSGHPKEIWTLGVLTLINRIGTMVIPFLTVYLTTILDYSLKEAGILAGAFGLGSLFGSYVGGYMSDRKSPTWVIFYSLFFSGILLVCLQWVYTFYAFFGLIFVTAFFGEAYRPAVSASVGHYVPKEQTSRSMAFIRLCISVGMMLAPVIGGFVAVQFGYNFLFWIDGVTCVLASIFLGFVTRTWKSQEQARSNERNKNADELGSKPQEDRNYLLFLLATFIMGFAYIQWINTVPVFIKSEWGYHEGIIGTVLGTSSLIVVLFELAMAHRIEKAGRIRLASFLGLLMVGLSFVPFLLPKAVLLCFVAVVFWTMGKMLFMPFNNAMPLNMSPPSRRGEYMAWYWMAWSLTLIIGPSLGLSMAELIGFDGFWLFLGGLSIISLVMNVAWANRILPGKSKK